MPKKRNIYRGINIVRPRAVPVIISLCRTAKIADKPGMKMANPFSC